MRHYLVLANAWLLLRIKVVRIQIQSRRYISLRNLAWSRSS